MAKRRQGLLTGLNRGLNSGLYRGLSQKTTQRNVINVARRKPVVLDLFRKTVAPLPRLSVSPPARPVRNALLDGRMFHPSGKNRPSRNLNGTRVRPFVARGLDHIGFADVKKAVVCVRRKQRREILFAKRFGSGGIRRRKPFNRKTQWSDVRC